MKYELIQGNCILELEKIRKKFDLVIVDLPYGITNNAWDKRIDLKKMGKLLENITNDDTAIIMFGQMKFSAELMMSNLENYRYSYVWDKQLKSGFLNANKQPLRQHEDILIFYKKQPKYNPQLKKGKPNNNSKSGKKKKNNYQNKNYSNFKHFDYNNDLGDNKYPTTILSFAKTHPSKSIHPTEKPVKLLEFLIKTYSNENDNVLDFTMGSGSTGVACKNTNRNFTGIELNAEYYNIAKKRINNLNVQTTLF